MPLCLLPLTVRVDLQGLRGADVDRGNFVCPGPETGPLHQNPPTLDIPGYETLHFPRVVYQLMVRNSAERWNNPCLVRPSRCETMDV